MVASNIVTPMTVYYQDSTTNQSFMKMHYFLRAKGIKNNKFFLIIYDAGLMGVDPRDPSLSTQMKLRIMRECMINYWYWIREVLRIPEEGGVVGSGKRYELNRANLAMSYCFVYNINQFVEIPRQFGKTIGALSWYLWLFNFGATNMRMTFANKKHDDAKRNLMTLRNIRSALPEYLRMESAIGPDGKQIRAPKTAETLQNPINKNIIGTLPGARTPGLADGAGRGLTTPIIYYDEFAFLPYNDIVYTAAAPAFSTASENAKKNGVNYGILITTTPGDMSTREGQFAKRVRDNATEWYEQYYDYSYPDLKALMDSNDKSTFMHIRYTYQMLGRGEEYFARQVKQLESDWKKIRREILLEWIGMSDNNPFNPEDLDLIGTMVKQEPIAVLRFGKMGQFILKIWDQIPIDSNYPLIVGVDVASGNKKDYSAITVIDSQTTKVVATFKSNFITTPELADMIHSFVSTYAKNAIVNIENNGIGTPVIQMLMKTSIKKNLYYEIKDRLDEEQFDGTTVSRRRKKCKVFGSTSSLTKRNQLIELLHQRVQHHRDKFATKDILDELLTMVVKPNGKTEHADDAHDDLTFSYLWALYVFYFGEDLATRFHLMKTEIYTDDHYDETSYSLEEEYDEFEQVDESVFRDPDDSVSKIIDQQLAYLNSKKSMSFSEFNNIQYKEEQLALEKIKQTPQGREAIANAYHLPLDYIEKENKFGVVDISTDIDKIFYGTEQNKIQGYDGNLSNIFRQL